MNADRRALAFLSGVCRPQHVRNWFNPIIQQIMNRKLLFAFLPALISVLAFSSCSDDPVYEDPSIVLTTEVREVFSYGESRDFELSLAGDCVSTTVDAPLGWTATIDGGKLTVTAPAADDPTKENTGAVTVAGAVLFFGAAERPTPRVCPRYSPACWLWRR